MSRYGRREFVDFGRDGFVVGVDPGVPGSDRAAAVMVERRPDGTFLVHDCWTDDEQRPPPELGRNGKPVIDVDICANARAMLPRRR